MLTPLGSGWQHKLELVLEKLQLRLNASTEPHPRIEAARIEVDPRAMNALCRYLDLLVEWNSRVDLTAARSNDELLDLMVTDALVLARCSEAGQRWVDVGSGAGAPGVALSLVKPGLSVTLVEPRQKRTAFLRALIGMLAVDRLRVERARAEDLEGGAWEMAVSRATFAPQEWLLRGTGLASAGVWVLLARGEAPRLAGWGPDLDIEYEWPLVGVARRAVRYVRERGI